MKNKLFSFIATLSLVVASNISLADTKNGFDLNGSLIPAEDIYQGGPPRDGIPSIDDPVFTTAKNANSLADTDRVLGVVHNGVAKAYPIAILNWHEIVNDKFKGERIVVSFCPLCGTGVVFTTKNKRARTFGVSGLLYNSDMLLYDRETKSLWAQIEGMAISGKLKGEQLSLIPVSHTTWADWRKRYPQSQVLSRDTGASRDYDRDPYSGYENSDGLYFSVTNKDPRYHPKERVVGVEINGQYKVYPFSELAQEDGDEVTDQFAGVTLRIIFDGEHQSATVYSEENVEIPSLSAFWFAWMAFHPDSLVFTAD